MRGTDNIAGDIPPIFLGAGSRVATAVTRHWTGPLLRVARSGTPDLLWDMSGPPPPLRPVIRGCALFCFAGVTPLSDTPPGRNTDLALAALAAARAWGVAHVFVFSSSAVYGDPGADPVAELPAPQPLNAYGAAKLDMERAVLSAVAEGAPPCTLLRLGNVAGAGQPFDAARAPSPDSLTLHRFADGTGPSRSFIGPRSLARVLACLCAHVARGTDLPTLLNVAAPTPTAMADILTGLHRRWHWAPAPVGAIPRVHLDTTRLAGLCALPAEAGTARSLIAELAQETHRP